MSQRFQDRLSDFPLPAKNTGERPRIYAAARGTGGRILTRRSLVGLLAAGAAGVFPRAARGAACSGTCSTGAFAHEILLASLSFSPDGKTLITAGQDLFVKIWTVPNGALFRTISTVDVPYRLAVSPDGNWIAVGMAHGNLQLWSADGQRQRALAGHTDTVGAVAFAPNSQTLVSASLDHTTKIWSRANQQFHRWYRRHEHGGGCTAGAFPGELRVAGIPAPALQRADTTEPRGAYIRDQPRRRLAGDPRRKATLPGRVPEPASDRGGGGAANRHVVGVQRQWQAAGGQLRKPAGAFVLRAQFGAAARDGSERRAQPVPGHGLHGQQPGRGLG